MTSTDRGNPQRSQTDGEPFAKKQTYESTPQILEDKFRGVLEAAFE
jgi:hypothetical protein